MSEEQDRVVGSFLGLAIGDALGCPAEGHRPETIQQTYGEIRGYVDPEDILGRRIYRWRRPSLYSDDTQQALALAEVLIDRRAVEPEALAETFAAVAAADSSLDLGGWRGIGRNFRQLVQQLLRGDDWISAGHPSGGNGAAMRVAPVALYFRDEPERITREAALSALFTHRDPVGVLAAVAQAHLVALALGVSDPEAADPAAIVAQLVDRVREGEALLSGDGEFAHLIPEELRPRLAAYGDLLAGLGERLEREEEELREFVVSQANALTDADLTRPTVAFAAASAPWAAAIALSMFADPEGAILTAVNGGGDADTIAAMVGSVVGAANGLESLPADWRSGLANRRQLELRALGLFHRRPQPEQKPLAEMERDLTQKETEEREARARRAGVDLELPPPKRRRPRGHPADWDPAPGNELRFDSDRERGDPPGRDDVFARRRYERDKSKSKRRRRR